MLLPVEAVERKTRTPEKYFLDAAKAYICNVSKAATKHYLDISDKLLGEMNDGKLNMRSDVVTRLMKIRMMGSRLGRGWGERVVCGSVFFLRD